MKSTLRISSLVLAVGMLFATSAAAQVQISGTITDKDTGEVLPGANVVVEGTTLGGATDADGHYAIPGVSSGTISVTASFIGYESATKRVSVGSSNLRVDFALSFSNQSLEALEVFASRAVDRKTPVAYTNIEKVQIQRELGSRDAPLVLNSAPSVYATAQGGGAGDARINVRGFNQRNVAIMINGVPVNDMENGWVYWSNWDGVGDATSSMQLQRGLSAVNLATPSIGGTMNIITDPAAIGKSFKLKQEVGNDGFLKTTAFASTGLIDGKYAISAAGVRKTGDGLYQGTWTDAWAYYFSASYNVNDKNRLDFFALGAPQRHGQNLYKQNLASYDQSYAKSVFDSSVLGLDEDNNGTADIFDKFGAAGRTYNENVSDVSSSYTGQQATGSSTFSRYDKNFINERENFFHKPQINLNWYSQFSDKALLSTVLYYSGGRGGGTGTKGSLKWDYSGPSRVVDYDATVARNAASSTGSTGVLRNSRNNQWTVGLISKLKLDVNDATTVEVGVDWRTAEIAHFREVRDLLGGSYYQRFDSDFWGAGGKQLGLGDKFNYNNTNTVDWFGTFAQGEYQKDKVSVYGMAGLSTIKYTFRDDFKDDGTGNPLKLSSDNIWGIQVKGGGLYNINDQVGAFVNAGYVSKVPILDGVIDDNSGVLNPDPKNEKFISVEAGLNFRSKDRSLSGKVNVYNTQWNDRTMTRGVQLANGDEGIINLLGLDASHTGVEGELAYQPISRLRFDGAASIGNWKYTNDVTARYVTDFSDPSSTTTLNLYVKDLKVGDAPQTQFAFAATVFPVDGLYAKVTGRNYSNFYADFDPVGRTDAADRTQSWKTPSYSVFDVNVGYDLPVKSSRYDIQLFANIFNVFDEIYIQDAVDNSRFNAFKNDGKNHRADDAEVFLGLPRTFNIGTTVTFK